MRRKTGKTVRIEATGDFIEVFVDGVSKLTWTEPGTLFTGAGHRRTGLLGHGSGFDDYSTIGEITTTTTGGTVTRVHHTLAGQTLGTTIDGEFTATLTDHLGSGATTRTSDGTTLTQAYTPYGVIRGGGTNTLLTDRTFTGQTDDPGTGLIDYNARAYDPLLGRFVMADTVLDGLNRYTYVRNQPTRFVDPTGNVCYVSGPKKGQCYDGSDGESQSMSPKEEALTVHVTGGDGLNPYGSLSAAENLRFTAFDDLASQDIIDMARHTDSGYQPGMTTSWDELFRDNLMHQLNDDWGNIGLCRDGDTQCEWVARNRATIASGTAFVVCVAASLGACAIATVTALAIRSQLRAEHMGVQESLGPNAADATITLATLGLVRVPAVAAGSNLAYAGVAKAPTAAVGLLWFLTNFLADPFGVDR